MLTFHSHQWKEKTNECSQSSENIATFVLGDTKIQTQDGQPE